MGIPKSYLDLYQDMVYSGIRPSEAMKFVQKLMCESTTAKSLWEQGQKPLEDWVQKQILNSVLGGVDTTEATEIVVGWINRLRGGPND